MTDNVKRMFKHRAKSLGFQYDTTIRGFAKFRLDLAHRAAVTNDAHQELTEAIHPVS